MKLKLLLFAPIIMASLFSCGDDEKISVKPQTKDSIKTDTIKADTVRDDSTRDSLDWYHLEKVRPIDYNLSTDLIPVYAASYKNIYVGNILYVNASTLQEPKFVSNINYLEKIDIMCEYNANYYSSYSFSLLCICLSLIPRIAAVFLLLLPEFSNVNKVRAFTASFMVVP